MSYCKAVFLNTDIFSDRQLFERWYSLMPEYRKEKIDSLKFNSSKRLSLGAGTLIYKFKPEAKVLFTEKGKPYFKDYPDIHFNLSHSGTMAMLCISDLTVGCDLEEISRAPLNIASRYFSEKENKFLNSIEDPEERNRNFYKIWTLKESYIKATGSGLSEDFSCFSAIPSDSGIIFEQKESENLFSFKQFDCIPEYCCSCCVINSPESCEFSSEFTSALF